MSKRDTTETPKKPYRSPNLRSHVVSDSPAVMLACTGQVDCDALLGLGYKCCAANERECGGC